MPYRFLPILLTLLVGLRATGQPTGPNPVVVDMLRATVEFLATDTTQFRNVTDRVCNPCQTYDELSRFAARNSMPGVDDLIEDARRTAQKSLNSDPATMPLALEQFLLDQVINDPKRGYRAQLAGYAAYKQQLAVLANPTTDPPTAGEEFGQSETPDDTAQDGTNDFLPAPQPNETRSSMDIMPILALLLSAISLAGLIVLWFRKPAASAQPTILPDDKINQLANRVAKLETENRQLTNLVESLRQSVGTLNRAAAQSQRTNQSIAATQQAASQPVQPAKATSAPEPMPSQPAAVVAPAVPPTNPYQNPTLLYGRTADLGDGFSVRGLLEKPDRDTIFEIVRTGAAHATFQVSDNPGLQQLALSDAYSYLNDTCVYTTQPKPGNRIRTEKPGTLSLQGEKWVITDKAQISFLG